MKALTRRQWAFYADTDGSQAKSRKTMENIGKKLLAMKEKTGKTEFDLNEVL